jgi:hypothetical protein
LLVHSQVGTCRLGSSLELALTLIAIVIVGNCRSRIDFPLLACETIG